MANGTAPCCVDTDIVLCFDGELCEFFAGNFIQAAGSCKLASRGVFFFVYLSDLSAGETGRNFC